MILLGVDFGFKRIGLATTDSDVGMPRALRPLAASGTLKRDAESILKVAQAESAEAVVLGLPLEPSGEEGRMARICRQVGSELDQLGMEVHYVDESMSSFASEGAMIEAGVKASVRKKRLDGEAAALILKRYLRQHDERYP